MPFTTKDVAEHTKKATTAKLRRAWLATANGQLKKCIADGGTDKTCAPRAIRMANGVVKKRVEEMNKDSTTDTVQASDNVARFKDGVPAGETELEESSRGWVDEPMQWSPATSFADLGKERETNEAADSLRQATSDFVMMVDNIMWKGEIEDKPAALRSLFAEFAIIVEEDLGDVSTAMELVAICIQLMSIEKLLNGS